MYNFYLTSHPYLSGNWEGKVILMSYPTDLFCVYVNAYIRVRLGRVEHVCAHWRRLPNCA